MNYIATIKKLRKYEGYPNKYPNKLNNYSESLNPGEIYPNVVSEKKL